jgi:hypothetical protein
LTKRQVDVTVVVSEPTGSISSWRLQDSDRDVEFEGSDMEGVVEQYCRFIHTTLLSNIEMGEEPFFPYRYRNISDRFLMSNEIDELTFKIVDKDLIIEVMVHVRQ